jgi:D-tyrosyl-tRNA(Tyr) deacylase
MRAVVQRVTHAAVRIGERVAGEIHTGLLVLLSVGVDDGDADAAWMAEKIAGLRIFKDERGLMNDRLAEVGGSVLLISQFTLHGDARKGRRPSFIAAAPEPIAKPLYERVGLLIERTGTPVAYGEFGAYMQVELLNDGPVTILLDSKRVF